MKDFPQGTTHIDELSGELWARLETMAMDGHAISFGQNYSHDGKFLGGDVTHYLTCEHDSCKRRYALTINERQNKRNKESAKTSLFGEAQRDPEED